MVEGIKRLCCKLILGIRGWKVVYNVEEKEKKFIVIGAPHTSNWDFVYAIPAMYLMGIKNLRYLIKKEFFFFPMKYLFYATGGIPVDRSKKNDLTAQLKALIDENEEIHLLFPPEGTRSRVDRWKTGFYYTALDTGLPIILGYMDYKNRILGYGKVFYPSGDFNADFEEIEQYYLDKGAKHPKDFNPKIFTPK